MFTKGNNANPGGVPNASREALRKIRAAINMGIDNMRSGTKTGVVALAEKVTTALNKDTIHTLSRLAPLLPRDITTEIVHSVAQMTREQLLDALADCDKVLQDNPGSELH